MLAFLHVSLGCRRLTVLSVVELCAVTTDLCLVRARVLKLAALLVPRLVCIAVSFVQYYQHAYNAITALKWTSFFRCQNGQSVFSCEITIFC